MKQVAMSRVLAVLLAVFLTAGAAWGEDLPPEVAAKVKELAPEGTITKTQLRDRRGVQVYRVDLDLKNNLEGRIELQKDGTVVDLKLELTEAQLPEPMKKAIAEMYPGAAFDNADRNLNDGVMVVDVEYTLNGQKFTATLDDTGKVLDREDFVTAAQLPAAARAVLDKDFPGANVIQVRRLTQNGKDSFEARLERRFTVNLPDPKGSTTSVQTVNADQLPEATRAALQAAAGRDPKGLAIQMKVTSPVTVYEVEIYDRRLVVFALDGTLISQVAEATGRGGPGGPGGQNGRGRGGPGNQGGWGNQGGAGGQPAQAAPAGQNENFARGQDPNQDQNKGANEEPKHGKGKKGEAKPEGGNAQQAPAGDEVF